ncbi:hypothetical protein TcYC6_0062110 [Trypanosoma cruzi]|nr:hypothetical protein TcYC6_0029070 [Trypanosoma cruzi]KAF8284506.1 hypothetical protein TcYC6_0029080 [Trypanosoma cruzi]KAF8300098.1 hypothetical protein TcYC6_0062110 [Trypanosoma cruzi]RNC53558.1 hypothetical protein TcCL_ESM09095 [Trypanosoma cruzi]
MAAQCSVVGPQLLLHHVDDLLRRLYSIHFASAFIHADGRTLVALCADIRVRAAAMPTAVSPITTWAAEHSLKINADGSGPALFCIASHRQSGENTADYRLGDGNQRVKSHPVRLLGNAIDRHPNFDYARFHRRCRADRATLLSAAAGCRGWGVPAHHAILFGWVRPQCVAPRRRGNRTVSGPHSPPQPGSAAPRQLHCIARPTRSKEGYFCPPGSQSSTAAEDHWVPRTTQHKRHVRFHNHGICAPLSTRNLCLRPCMGKRRHRSRSREMLLLMN